MRKRKQRSRRNNSACTRAFANVLFDKIQEIMPPPDIWLSMPLEEKERWLREQKDGFLLPLALGKALAKGILKPSPGDDPNNMLSTMENMKDVFDRKIPYKDKPRIVHEVIRDLIEAGYIGFVNLKTKKTEEGELYAYFPPDNILLEPEESIDLIVLSGISDASEMLSVIGVALRELKAKAKKITLENMNPQHLIPLGKGKVFDLNDFEVKENKDYYFDYELAYPPSIEFLKMLKDGKIDEHYFENEEWYKIFRKHYDDYNWNKLELCIGTIYAGRNTDEKFTILGTESLTRKTTLLTTLLEALRWKGEERGYIIASSLKKISDPRYRFSLEEAFGAKAIVCSEEKEAVVRSVDIIKNIVGGDAQSLERKFEHHRTVITSLAILVASNEIPIFPSNIGKQDVSRKVNLVYTQNPSEWTEEEKEAMRKADMRKVHEWAIYCLWRLRNAKYRIKTEEEIDRVHTELIEARTYVKEFIRKCCIYGNFRIAVESLFKAFEAWRIKEGKRTIGKNKFSEEILRISAEEGKIVEKTYPSHKATFLGITVNPDVARELGVYDLIKGELMEEEKGKLTNLEEKEEELNDLGRYARLERTEKGTLFKCAAKTERGECGIIFADKKSLKAHLEKRHGIKL
jgi:hypothetical protein